MNRVCLLRRFMLAGLSLLCTASLFTACKHEPQQTPASASAFPPEVARIFVSKCATAGCHNQASSQNAAGLLLDTWAHMLEGGNNGSVVVPFAPGNSSLMYFVNHDTTNGDPVAYPTMPLNSIPLSEAEYASLRSWIANGAPNAEGKIPFSERPESRQKLYLTMQGCDMLGVIDGESKLMMRYIQLGKSLSVESPHCVKVSPDGRYAYVSFLAGEYFQKIDTYTDQIVGELYLGSGSWNVFHLSADGKKAIMSDWAPNGKLLLIDTENMSIIRTYGSVTKPLIWPHGITSTPAFDTFFVTAQYGNVLYRVPANAPFDDFSLDGNPETTTPGPNTPDPHEIMISPDGSKLFVSCEKTNEVRVLDARTMAVLGVLPTGAFPQELAMSYTKPYLFVTCMRDPSNRMNYEGSVYVFNYNTMQLVSVLKDRFNKPHGVTVDDRNGLVYIASTNKGGYAHHASSCSGTNGWYSVYDLNTLQAHDNKRYEVSVEPYSFATRFQDN